MDCHSKPIKERHIYNIFTQAPTLHSSRCYFCCCCCCWLTALSSDQAKVPKSVQWHRCLSGHRLPTTTRQDETRPQQSSSVLWSFSISCGLFVCLKPDLGNSSASRCLLYYMRVTLDWTSVWIGQSAQFMCYYNSYMHPFIVSVIASANLWLAQKRC